MSAPVVGGMERQNKGAQGKYWCFTVNNPDEKDEDIISALGEIGEDKTARYVVWQKERGENGTLHLQGYIEFNSNQRLKSLKERIPRGHFEIRRGSAQQASDYCKKSDGRVDGPWEYGELKLPEKGKRTDIIALKKDLDEMKPMKDICSDHFPLYLKYGKMFHAYKKMRMTPRSEKTVVTVLFGKTNTGKTHTAREMAPNAFWLTRPRGETLWWDGYDGHEEVVIDEFYGWIKFDLFLRLLDAYPLSVEIKGGMVEFVAKKIIITSNKSPCDWYPKIDSNHWSAMERRIENIIDKKSREESIYLKKDGVTQGSLIRS